MILKDYPAAHSMDSGWFAVDSDGVVAHFDTGEAGAMPNDATYATGEASGGDETRAEELWLVHILPWVARNLETAHLPNVGAVYALFDTSENAKRAQSHGGREVPENELFVEVLSTPNQSHYAEGFEGLEGFVGFAPTLDEIYDNPEMDAFPIVRYGHGDWDIPGHYVREHLPKVAFVVPPEVAEELPPMNVQFAKSIDVVKKVARQLNQAGIHNDSIVYLQMRGQTSEPSPSEIAHVAGGPFQSMTCLKTCGKSPRFCSLNARKEAAHCSYTTERRTLETLDALGLHRALAGLGVLYCGVAV